MEKVPCTCVKLKINLQYSHSLVFDLSGTNPSNVFFQVDRFRGGGGGWRSITLLLEGSQLLDGSLLDAHRALTPWTTGIDQDCFQT